VKELEAQIEHFGYTGPLSASTLQGDTPSVIAHPSPKTHYAQISNLDHPVSYNHSLTAQNVDHTFSTPKNSCRNHLDSASALVLPFDEKMQNQRAPWIQYSLGEDEVVPIELSQLLWVVFFDYNYRILLLITIFFCPA